MTIHECLASKFIWPSSLGRTFSFICTLLLEHIVGEMRLSTFHSLFGSFFCNYIWLFNFIVILVWLPIHSCHLITVNYLQSANTWKWNLVDNFVFWYRKLKILKIMKKQDKFWEGTYSKLQHFSPIFYCLCICRFLWKQKNTKQNSLLSKIQEIE